MKNVTTDVVVVGAGVSGLVAADHLKRLGHEVMVLDGADRIGGRTLNVDLAGVPVDAGAAFVGPHQKRVIALLDRFDLKLRRVRTAGENVSVIGGKRATYRGTIPKLPLLTMLDYARVEWQLNRVLKRVQVVDPWAGPGALEIDRQSVDAWLRDQRALASTREVFAIMIRVLFGCEPDEISLLHAARYIKAAGGLDKTLAVEGGSQQDVIVGGFQQIAMALAAELGDRIHLNQAVRNITTHDDHTIVESDGLRVRCRYVVVAVHAIQRAAIRFEPALPDTHQLLSQRWRNAALTKAMVAYETPFWRADGLSGASVGVGQPAFLTFDIGGDDGPGLLMAFVDTREFDALPAEQRRELILDQLTLYFGPQARQAIDYVDHRWAVEPFGAGAPFSIAAPHGLTQHGRALREPVGRLHWAGTDTADEYVGYVEGAVAAGERAAAEVVARLGVATAELTRAS